MGSLFSPVNANFFMECFEQLMLESGHLKPKVWLRYVDDAFVVWNHDEELQLFLKHTNSKNKNIPNSPWKRKKMIYFLFSTHWHQERGTDLGTKSTENRYILTDICTRNPIIIPAKTEEL